MMFKDFSELEKIKTEAYSVVLHGKQTPLSVCCNQLICFQFTKQGHKLNVNCLDPNCRKPKLETKLLHP